MSDQVSSRLPTWRTISSTTRRRGHRRPFSFAFDIDGVLLKSSKPIPGAIEALRLLREHSVPFILLTNGGGLSESQRTADLSRHLGMPISTQQFIQSHTPFQRDAGRYKNVLVCGGVLDACRKVAGGYGFPHVTIPFDILACDESVWPYHTLTKEERECTAPLSTSHPIDAIYVYHDPRDWGLDSQIILDVLLAKHDTQGQNQHIPLYFSNPDLLWANAYARPRFGQGAFQILIEGLFTAVTGQTLRSTTIGKPSHVTYEYAETVLASYQAQLNNHHHHTQENGQGTVYMVGDNKYSDIQGANAFGWESILVQTGVFAGTKQEGLEGDIPAKYCVAHVKDAVELVLKKEGVLN